MDYITKPISRKDLRLLAQWARSVFKCKNKLRFDAVGAFEKITERTGGKVTTEIVEDNDTSIIADTKVPAACIPDFEGGYHIVIRERVYDGACKGIGGYRAHIVHEMSHAILCLFGFTPILERSFGNNKIQPLYRSMEWQAKALTGEILVPYEETIGMSERQIRFYCKVSANLAKHRLSLDGKKEDA